MFVIEKFEYPFIKPANAADSTQFATVFQFPSLTDRQRICVYVCVYGCECIVPEATRSTACTYVRYAFTLHIHTYLYKHLREVQKAQYSGIHECTCIVLFVCVQKHEIITNTHSLTEIYLNRMCYSLWLVTDEANRTFASVRLLTFDVSYKRLA